MKNFFSFVCLLLSITVNAQLLHTKSMHYFTGDINTPLLNVYDVNKESLLKSINCGETVINSKISFNKEETKLYRLGLKYAYIIDPVTLEEQKIQLFSDEELLVRNSTKLMEMNEAESKRVLKEIEDGNLEAKYTETHEMIKMKALPLFILPFGLSENGIAITQRITTENTEYLVFDLNQAGKKVNSIKLPSGSDCTMYDGHILVFEQDGSITILDPLTGNNIGKMENAFDAKDFAEIKSKSTGASDKIRANIMTWGNYLITVLNFGIIPGTANFNYAYSIYDITNKSIIYSERSSQYTPSIRPVLNTNLFQRVVPKTPKPELVIPAQPDFTKYNYKDIKNGVMAKASQDYTDNVNKVSAEWKIKFAEWNNPQNFSTKIFSSLNSTQELWSVDASNGAFAKGNYMIFYKEMSIEFYDINTKLLVHTIYLI